MIKFTESMKCAEETLNALNSMVDEKRGVDNEAFWVEAYSNGREQGYCVRSSRMTASIGQLRGSDAIIVYLGGAYDFSMQGNVPLSGNGNIDTRCFEKQDADKAAQVIYEAMVKANPSEEPKVA